MAQIASSKTGPLKPPTPQWTPKSLPMPGTQPSAQPYSPQPKYDQGAADKQNAAYAAQDDAARRARAQSGAYGISPATQSAAPVAAPVTTPVIAPVVGSSSSSYPVGVSPAGGGGVSGGGGGGIGGGGVSPSLQGLQSAAGGEMAGSPDAGVSAAMLEAPGSMRQGIGTRLYPENSAALAGLRRIY